MSFLQNTYSMIFRPSHGFSGLGNNYSSGLLLEALSILLLIATIQGKADLSGLFSYLSSWFIFSSLIFLMAFIFKLEASDYPRFLTLLAFANIPMIFMAPINLLTEFNSTIAFAFNLAILIWAFNLNIIAIAEICKISKLRASLIYLLPPLAISFFVAKFIVGSISQLINLLT